jgi:hypothetical protein
MVYDGNIVIFQIGFQQRENANKKFEVFRAVITTL